MRLKPGWTQTVNRMSKEYPVWRKWWAEGRPGAMTAAGYEAAMEDWVAQAAHSGPTPSVKYAGYTQLNLVRMRRLAKTHKVSDAMAAFLDSGCCASQHWVVITESWCGDAVQLLPLVRLWAERAGVGLDVILRDGNDPVIDDFLTRGGRSIPIWVVANETGQVLGQWGPRPATAKKMVLDHRNAPEPKPPYAEFAAQVQLWYARDKGREIEHEALSVLHDLCQSRS